MSNFEDKILMECSLFGLENKMDTFKKNRK